MLLSLSLSLAIKKEMPAMYRKKKNNNIDCYNHILGSAYLLQVCGCTHRTAEMFAFPPISISEKERRSNCFESLYFVHLLPK